MVAGEIPLYFTHPSNGKGHPGGCYNPDARPADPSLMYSDSKTSNGLQGAACPGAGGGFHGKGYGGGAGFPGGPGNKCTGVNQGTSQGASYGATVFNDAICPDAVEETISAYDGIYLYTDYGSLTFVNVKTGSDSIRIF